MISQQALSSRSNDKQPEVIELGRIMQNLDIKTVIVVLALVFAFGKLASVVQANTEMAMEHDGRINVLEIEAATKRGYAQAVADLKAAQGAGRQ